MKAEDIQDIMAKAECLCPREKVEAALDRIADEIRAKYENANPILLCVVVGGIIPMGKLLDRLHFPLEVDYIHATRYQGDTVGSSTLEWKATPSIDLSGRVVIVVDDILDKGITLAEVVRWCKAQHASEVRTVALVDKQVKRDDSGLETADFTGVEIEDRYLFGYGLDYHGYLRNMPGIYALPKS